jgi:acyl-CoA synthetase (AMP-forming)/AMP-acid ligase II
LVAAAAGSLAVAAYLNAKHRIAHDLKIFTSKGNPFAAQASVAKKFADDEMLTFNILEKQALHNRPDQAFIIFEGQIWTYRQFFDAVTRVGNWLLQDLNIQRGEIIALCGGNSPEYLMICYAIEGIGALPSFVNNNLNGQSLFHGLKVSTKAEHCTMLKY